MGVEGKRERKRQSEHGSELRLQKRKKAVVGGRSQILERMSFLNHCYSTWNCLAAPSFGTLTYSCWSHTILHIFQQSLTLDSPSNHSSSFLSSVCFKASVKPSWVQQRDLLTLLLPSLVSLTYPHPFCLLFVVAVHVRDSYCRHHTVALWVRV